MTSYRNVLIVGATQGIGYGFVQQLLANNDVNKVIATYRNSQTAQELFKLQSSFPDRLITVQIDVTQEDKVKEAVNQIKTHISQLHLAINCVGMLHEDNLQPEKSLRHIDRDRLLRYFEVNTIPTALLSKHLLPLFKHPQFSVWATISAKVGSIEDNRLGGWYGYRASKAALNMLIKNVAIEYNRVSKNTIVIALHPGTTDTQLSLPFQKNVPEGKLFSTELCTRQLLDVIDKLTINNNGQFFNWDGGILPW